MAAAIGQVEQTIFIALPRPSVAAFVLNPLNEVIWCQGVQASRPSQPGRMVPGMQVERTVRLWGGTLNVVYRVTGVDGESGAELQVATPRPLLLRYRFDAEAAGTRFTLGMEADAGGWLMPAGPLLRPFIARRMRRELWLLKRHLEHASSPAR